MKLKLKKKHTHIKTHAFTCYFGVETSSTFLYSYEDISIGKLIFPIHIKFLLDHSFDLCKEDLTVVCKWMWSYKFWSSSDEKVLERRTILLQSLPPVLPQVVVEASSKACPKEESLQRCQRMWRLLERLS